MGGTVCYFCCNTRNKYRKLRPELESKLVEAIRQRSISKESSFKSINAIIMRFPQFKEGLQNIRHVFKEFGKLPRTLKLNVIVIIKLEDEIIISDLLTNFIFLFLFIVDKKDEQISFLAR